uniref:Uncharacterized protein n=1 Tax=Ananas comosus var. bracteatus TaxID=296719 RepID=A0A6V7NHL3_ANACO|nr:unnamed protein product [Ananas comosus var. bracteatus]
MGRMLEAKSLRKALIPPSPSPTLLPRTSNHSPRPPRTIANPNHRFLLLLLLSSFPPLSWSLFLLLLLPTSGQRRRLFLRRLRRLRVPRLQDRGKRLPRPLRIALEDSTVSKGKESLLIPVHAQVVNSSVVDRCPHRSEIQSVVLAEGDDDNFLILGTVDSYGHLIISRLDTTAAVARSFCKSIDVYDQDIHLRNLRTLWYPSSLSFIQSSISPSGEIAVGGTDRTVTVYDPRRWSAISRWVNCSKYEITGLSFSSIDSAYIYVQGVDYEVMCGQWRESEKAFSFRGDSNWLGFCKCANRDLLAGWCDSGSIFIADFVPKQYENL